MKTTSIATIDIGSNTIHLLVARVGEAQPLVHLDSHSIFTQLGVAVVRGGGLEPRYIARLRKALKEQIEQARSYKPSQILIGATAALRNAPTGKEIAESLGRQIGIPVHLISRRREAELGFLGVRHLLQDGVPHLVADIGGASTEISLCRGKKRLGSASLPVGSGILSLEIKQDPPAVLELARVAGSIAEALKEAPRPPSPPRSALITGGSVHHLSMMFPESVSVLSRNDLNKVLFRLLKRRAKKISKKTGIQMEKMPTLVPSALIIGAILYRYGLDQATLTLWGIREGMIRAYLSQGDGWWKG